MRESLHPEGQRPGKYQVVLPADKYLPADSFLDPPLTRAVSKGRVKGRRRSWGQRFERGVIERTREWLQKERGYRARGFVLPGLMVVPAPKNPSPPAPLHDSGASGGSPPDPLAPSIRVNDRHRREITADALAALAAVNDPPRFFVLGSEIVRLRGGRAEPLSHAALSGVLDRSANFVMIGQSETKPARPPYDVVTDILSLPDLPLPPLRGIYRTPMLTSSGLLSVEGYDAETGLYLHLDGLAGVRTDLPLDVAKRLILEDVLGDFPFAEESSRAHAVGAILQRFVREVIQGPTPLYLVEAPTPGTGKGLFVEVVSIITAGVPAPVMALAPEEAEVEKRITADLLGSPDLLLLDNVSAIKSRALSAALTAEEWRGRRLGKSEIVRCPNRATWFATGNNPELSREIARRTISIRLDATMEHPEDRTDFRHPDLTRWVREHRSELVSACLSIVSAWRAAGSPLSTKTLGRFEGWAATIGGILEFAEVPGFLDNRETLNLSDRETSEWAAFLQTWEEKHGGAAIVARMLYDLAKESNLLPEFWAGKSVLSGTQRLGHALMAFRGRVFGGRAIRLAGRDRESKSIAWRVEAVAPRRVWRENPLKPPQPPANEAPDIEKDQQKNPAETPAPQNQNPRTQTQIPAPESLSGAEARGFAGVHPHDPLGGPPHFGRPPKCDFCGEPVREPGERHPGCGP